MGYSDQFFKALGIDTSINSSLREFAKKSNISVKKLKYYNDNNILPTGKELSSILNCAGITSEYLQLSMGRIDRSLIAKLQNNSAAIDSVLSQRTEKMPLKQTTVAPSFNTSLGALYQQDCNEFLRGIDDDSADLVFADPPFNLSKLYPSNIDDNLKTENYLKWCEEWLKESVRILKPGGSLFIWNLPKWNTSISHYLNGLLTFRHWIAVDIKYSLPIQNKLYPSHYSLLYYIKGAKPQTFKPDRLAMQVCNKCFTELKDYGGYKDKMNPKGINITDVWHDIPPVRHSKYKRRQGANELSLKLMDRIIQMSTNEGDLVVDPFGGSGTTYMAAELKGRRWLGSEIGPLDDIIGRFKLMKEEREILDNYRSSLNRLFTAKSKRERELRGIWTDESIRRSKKS